MLSNNRMNSKQTLRDMLKQTHTYTNNFKLIAIK